MENKEPIDRIIASVAEFYGITEQELCKGNRERKYSEPMHVAAYCIRRLLRMPYQSIAKVLGDKNHATIIYAEQKVGYWAEHPVFNRHAAECVTKIKQEYVQIRSKN